MERIEGHTDESHTLEVGQDRVVVKDVSSALKLAVIDGLPVTPSNGTVSCKASGLPHRKWEQHFTESGSQTRRQMEMRYAEECFSVGIIPYTKMIFTHKSGGVFAPTIEMFDKVHHDVKQHIPDDIVERVYRMILEQNGIMSMVEINSSDRYLGEDGIARMREYLHLLHDRGYIVNWAEFEFLSGYEDTHDALISINSDHNGDKDDISLRRYNIFNGNTAKWHELCRWLIQYAGGLPSYLETSSSHETPVNS